MKMIRAILLLIFALSMSSGFPSGRFERSRKLDVPIFPVKKAFEKFLLYMDDANPAVPRINNDYLPKGDTTIGEENLSPRQPRVSIFDFLKNTISESSMPEEFEGMRKIPTRRVQKPWRNGDFIDNYLRNFRSISGLSPVEIEDDLL